MVFEEIDLEEVSLVISTESSSWLGAPGAVKTVSDGYLMHDYGLETMHKLDTGWNKQFSFGGKGEGPGEFRTVYNFWELDDYYMVYDYESK